MFEANQIRALIFSGSLLLLLSCGGDKDKRADGQVMELNQSEGIVKERNWASLPPIDEVRNIRVKNIGPLAEVFNDSNHVHLKSAIEVGIDPVTDFSSAYFLKRPIVKITSNDLYEVDELTHSVAFLVPEAASLLEDIGRNFIDSLEKRGGDSYKIKVTSMLRTPSAVENLRKVNINAVDTSTHQFATTFDLSWTKFHCMNPRRQINDGDLKNLLAEVLQDLRKQGRCYVKFENKTACFHVTVRK